MGHKDNGQFFDALAKNLFETMAQGVVFQDANGSIFLANPAAERLLGLSQDQMMGKTSMDPDWKAIREDGSELPGAGHPAMLSLQTGKKVGPFIMGVFNPKNDAYTWISVTSIPMFQPGKTSPFRVYSTFDDITERKLAENILQENEHRLRRYVDNAPMASIEWDANAVVTMWAGEAEKIFGWSKAEAIGKSNNDLRMIHEEDLPLVENIMRKLIDGDSRYVISSNRNITKDGRVIYCEWYNTILVESQGKMSSVLSQVIDVTERRQALQTIIESQQQIKEMAFELEIAEEHERSRIAGELHDQVGQRLLLGKMKLDELANQASSEELAKEIGLIAEMVEQSIQDIRSLTFQMRPPLLATVGLVAAVRQLCIDLEEDYALEIKFCDDKKPKPLQYENSTALYRCVRELLLNVAKHAGTKLVQLDMKRDGDAIVITVVDQGIGFNPFEVNRKFTKKRGFGLFNVQQKIEYLGGHFAYESALGKGTRATILFPLEIKS